MMGMGLLIVSVGGNKHVCTFARPDCAYFANHCSMEWGVAIPGSWLYVNLPCNCHQTRQVKAFQKYCFGYDSHNVSFGIVKIVNVLSVLISFEPTYNRTTLWRFHTILIFDMNLLTPLNPIWPVNVQMKPRCFLIHLNWKNRACQMLIKPLTKMDIYFFKVQPAVEKLPCCRIGTRDSNTTVWLVTLLCMLQCLWNSTLAKLHYFKYWRNPTVEHRDF